jgi:hypothetical protein
VAVISGRGRKQLSWSSNVPKMGCIVISDGPKEKNQCLFISSKEKRSDQYSVFELKKTPFILFFYYHY